MPARRVLRGMRAGTSFFFAVVLIACSKGGGTAFDDGADMASGEEETGKPSPGSSANPERPGTRPDPDADLVDGGTRPKEDAGKPADVLQDFTPWTGAVSPDGLWRIAGDWTGTGANLLVRDNAKLTPTFGAESGGFLSLVSTSGVLRGSEIQTISGYGYGYYETRMQVASEPGVCDSFFWIEGGETSYGPLEWDVEFLTNESWINTPDRGRVHLTVHFNGSAYDVKVLDLPFNPSKAFHRYGFLWKPGGMDFTVDGKVVHEFTNAAFTTTKTGVIMMNSWTGNPDWGGGPPANDAVTIYDWVKFYKDAGAVP